MEWIMKTRLLQTWWLGMLAAAIPLVGGCVPDSEADTSKTTAQSTNAAPANSPGEAVAETAAEVPEDLVPPERAEPAPGSEARPVPADLKLSPGTAEIAKLARAGLGDTVLLAYVTNSIGTFNLGSDQIVYLNDLGVASEIITSMIEHDRLLREGAGTLPPLAPVAAPVAVSPQPDPAALAAAAAPQALPEAAPVGGEPPPAATTEAVPAPPANVTYNYFYDSLAPYGTWLDVDGYGYCWQPSVVVVNAGWRPYSQGGRWLYTDYGWYWNSDYSWGWAPFHYGRWFSHPRWGWCWRPDTIWGPSWVSWRYTDAYCGWAPLPPAAGYSVGVGFTYYGSSVGVSFGFGLGWGCYSYVPWGHFCDYRPYRHYAPPHYARDIHGHSTPANHFTHGPNNRPINHGPGEDRVRQYTKNELRPVRVREEAVAARNPRSAPGERLERGGRELVVRRPQFPETPAAPVLKGSPREAAGLASTAASTERRPVTATREGRPTTTRPAAARGKEGLVPAGGATSPSALTRSAPRESTSPGQVIPRGASSPPPRSPSPQTSPPSSPEVAKTPAAVSAPGVSARPSSSVTVIGRRETTTTSRPIANPASPQTSKPLEQSARPSPTTTWARTAESRVNPTANNVQRAPMATPSASPTPAPPVQRPTATFTRPVTPQSPTRTYSAPAPSVRVEQPRVSTPAAPSSPPAIARVPSAPTYSAPAPRPAPSFTPRPTPSAPSVAPTPRSSPSPSYTPGPAPAPSRPSPAPSSGSSGRSSGGGGRPGTQPQ